MATGDTGDTWIALNNAISALGRTYPHCREARVLNRSWGAFFDRPVRRALQSFGLSHVSFTAYEYYWQQYRNAYAACVKTTPVAGMPIPPRPDVVEGVWLENVERTIRAGAQNIADAGTGAAAAARDLVLAGVRAAAGSPWPWLLLAGVGLFFIGPKLAQARDRRAA